jgi:hypothetical protein
MSTLEESIIEEFEPDTTEEYEVDIEGKEQPEDDGEEIITIGEPQELTEEQIADLEEEKLPKIKEFRKAFKETSKKNRELEAKIKELEAPHQADQQPRYLAKPTLEGCEYDAEAYEAELLHWAAMQRRLQDDVISNQLKKESEEREWQGRVSKYEHDKSKLKVSDFDSAEDAVLEMLSIPQQSLILKYCKDPARMVFAIGNAKEKAKELGKIQDPIQFALALQDIERDMKVTKRQSIEPEKRLNFGTGTVKHGAKNTAHLEKLMEKAIETGDFTDVARYKKQMAG